MFTKGTLRYTALAAVNILVGVAMYFRPDLVTSDVFTYTIAGNFLIAGADILKHIRNKIPA